MAFLRWRKDGPKRYNDGEYSAFSFSDVQASMGKFMKTIPVPNVVASLLLLYKSMHLAVLFHTHVHAVRGTCHLVSHRGLTGYNV